MLGRPVTYRLKAEHACLAVGVQPGHLLQLAGKGCGDEVYHCCDDKKEVKFVPAHFKVALWSQPDHLDGGFTHIHRCERVVGQVLQVRLWIMSAAK